MTTRRTLVLCLVASAAVSLGLKAAASSQQQPPAQDAGVTFDRILRAASEPQNWFSYSGGVMSQRYTPLSEVSPGNVKNLEVRWVFQALSLEKFEATPLVVDGVMYTVQAPNDVVALDAATGRVFWVYSYAPSTLARPCCGRVNRGLAILGHTLFMGTLDGHMLAIDATTGGLVWNVAVGGARPEAGYGFTVAPLVVRDKVIVGTVGGEFGIRGFLAALDAKTGKELWRFNTIPGPGERGHETWAGNSWMTGGASVWATGSYDPETNQTFWGIGNPGPDWNGDRRSGDNLFSESVVALDADTGQLKWHFQFTPHDEFDYDSTQVPVLADFQFQGRLRKAMLWANRNGHMYVLDRTTGEFLLGKPFVKVNWTSGLDARGRPMNVVSPAAEGTLIYPGNQGGTNWYSPSYSPRTGLFYIPSWMDTFSTYIKRPVDFVEGQRFTGALPLMSVRMVQPGPMVNRRLPEEGYGAVQAFDPKTGEKRWEFKMADVTDSGVLSTASDLVFSGGREGYFFALDAKSGALLWKASVGGIVSAGPMAYSVGGHEHIAISAGSSLFVYALRQ
jgi:alcohol dehydrogenase (cytochrome c)